MNFHRRHMVLFVLTLAALLDVFLLLRPTPAPPIRIGVLHSLSGTMAAEDGLKAIGRDAFHPNHYAVWSYFQSIPGEANRHFVAAFQHRYGSDRVTSDPVEAAYIGVRLWAQAVTDAGTADPEQVNRAMLQQSLAAPSGIAAVDRSTRHLWKPVRIGKAHADGQFELVWHSGDALRPDPFPDYRSRFEWQRQLTELPGATP